MRKLLVAVALALSAAPASAVPLLWTLQNAAFDDGTTFAGSFIFDADTQNFSDWNITTNTGLLTGFQYTSASSESTSNLFGPNSVLFQANSGERYINLGFESALTNSGGSVNLQSGFGSYECDNCSTYRTVTGGSLSAGPGAPAPLVGMGFSAALASVGALFATRRRRKAANA